MDYGLIILKNLKTRKESINALLIMNDCQLVYQRSMQLGQLGFSLNLIFSDKDIGLFAFIIVHQLL